jgi:effector-binding domain-containing protein/uncharacterized protein YndB with AHSA1/START domain
MNKFLKIFIFILLAIAALYILACFLAPKKLQLEVEETIDAPPNLIYNLVNDLKHWEEWSPWAELDSNAVYTYSKRTEGVGASFTWRGNSEVGEGTQTIKESVLAEKIKLALEFNGVDGISNSTWKFKEENGKTKVSWDFDGSDTAFPFRIFNLLMKGGLKKSYQKGLTGLKGISEKRAKEKIYKGYKIKEMIMPEKHFILNRQEVRMENIQEFYNRNVGVLFAKAAAANIETDGISSNLFFKWDEENGVTDMATGLSVREPIDIKDMSSLTVPEGRALQVDYYGDSSKSSEAHYAIDEYMKDYGLLNDPPIIEENVTDLTQEKDPNKWLTRITYYIAAN